MNIEKTLESQETKNVSAPEIPRTEGSIIIVQRHGRYDSRRPIDPKHLEEGERAYGHLTEAGKQEVRDITLRRLSAILEEKPDQTSFLILNSPTFWLDEPELGQRAQETAEIIAETITQELEKRKLDRDSLLNNSVRIKGGATRAEERLGEAAMFQVPEFVNFLRQEYHGQGKEFWQAFNKDTHKEFRTQTGAEGPTDIANRINEVVAVAARFARAYQHKNPGKRLVVWMVTHGDGLEPYVQRTLGVPEEDFWADYNAAVGIALDEKGNGRVIINGKPYDIPITANVESSSS